MHVNRGLLGWGAFLITMGAVPLAVRGGFLDEDTVRRAWELWPLILIGIGAGLLLARTQLAVVGGLIVAITFGVMAGSFIAVGPGGTFSGCSVGGGDGTAFDTRTGELGGDARVDIQVNCGELTGSTGPDSRWSLSGSDEDGRGPNIRADASRLEIRSRGDRGFGFTAPDRWQITLPTEPRLKLDVAVNAGSGRLNLAGARVPSLDLSANAGDLKLDLREAAEVDRLTASANAGSISIALPAQSMSGSLSANAASIEVCAPAGVGLRFRASDNLTATYHFADAGLVRSGDTWTTPDFTSATVRLDFTANATAGSISLNPEGGCD